MPAPIDSRNRRNRPTRSSPPKRVQRLRSPAGAVRVLGEPLQSLDLRAAMRPQRCNCCSTPCMLEMQQSLATGPRVSKAQRHRGKIRAARHGRSHASPRVCRADRLSGGARRPAAKLRPLPAQAGRVSRLQPRRAVPRAVTTDERSPRLFDTGRTNASRSPPRGQSCEAAWNRASPPLATGTPVLLRDVRGFATNLGSTFRGRVTSRVRRNSSVSTVTDDS